jgi:osmotically-inducible protein OsmY
MGEGQGEAMNIDNQIRHDVERELEWEPSIDERRIAVAVLDRIVTLSGEVTSYAEKWKAERVAERVEGARGIVNEIEVKSESEFSDFDIAKAATDALKWNVTGPADKIKVKVENGWITLTGEANWDFQRRAAERAVRNLPGVRGIYNLITVKPRVEPKDVKERIEETFKREAAIDASRISVEVNGGEVTLRGTVRSWAERHEAQKAAWAAPGVTEVHNELIVEPLVAA